MHVAELYTDKENMSQYITQIMQEINNVENQIDGINERMDMVFQVKTER